MSTFYALCLRTGPWERYVVMTNCDFIRAVSKKTENDKSICLKSFQGIPNDVWLKMSGMTGKMINEISDEAACQNTLNDDDKKRTREARLARFNFR